MTRHVSHAYQSPAEDHTKLILDGTKVAGIKVGMIGNQAVENTTLRKWIKGCLG